MLCGIAAEVCNRVIKMNPFFTRGNKKGVVPIAVINRLCRVFCCSCTVGHIGSSITALHHARSAYHCIKKGKGKVVPLQA
jgi:hypothetical protein